MCVKSIISLYFRRLNRFSQGEQSWFLQGEGSNSHLIYAHHIIFTWTRAQEKFILTLENLEEEKCNFFSHGNMWGGCGAWRGVKTRRRNTWEAGSLYQVTKRLRLMKLSSLKKPYQDWRSWRLWLSSASWPWNGMARRPRTIWVYVYYS